MAGYTLNRPEAMNAIDADLPREPDRAMRMALSGDRIIGVETAEMGLVLTWVP